MATSLFDLSSKHACRSRSPVSDSHVRSKSLQHRISSFAFRMGDSVLFYIAALAKE